MQKRKLTSGPGASRRYPLFRALDTVLCVSLLTSCATLTPRSQSTSPAAQVIPNVPTLTWGIVSCGAGALSTVLQHYGDATSLDAWDAALPKTRGGVMTIDMLLAARQKGFDAQLVTGTPRLVEDEGSKSRGAAAATPRSSSAHARAIRS